MSSMTDSNHAVRSAHNIPFSAFQRPPPSRLNPIAYGSGRDNWTETNNIWQTTSNFSEFARHHDRRNVFSGMGGRAAKADVSSAAAQAPKAVRHSFIQPVIQKHDSTLNIALPNRLVGPLKSPTKLRSNGLLGPDGGTPLTSLGKSSLLSGSSPDIELPIDSMAMHENSQKPPDGKAPYRFDVGKAPEFVPAYLRDHAADFSANNAALNTSDIYFDGTQTGSNVIGSGYPYSLPFQLDTLSIRDHFQTKASAQTKGTETYPHAGAGQDTVHTTNDNRHSDTFGTRSYRQEPGVPRLSPNARGQQGQPNAPPQRSSSNLRADVASYRPISYTADRHADASSTMTHPYAYHEQGFPSNAIDAHAQHTTHTDLSSFQPDGFYTNETLTTGLSGNDPRPRPQDSSSKSPTTIEQSVVKPEMVGGNWPNSVWTSEVYNQPSYFQDQYNGLSYQYNPGSSSSGVPHTAAVKDAMTAYDFSSNGMYLADNRFNQGVPSMLLQDFNLNYKHKRYELRDIYNHIVEFSGDNAGSRFVQEKLATANSEEKERVFSEIHTNARQLMVDTFGNYVIQKMFDHGNQLQKKMLASNMKGCVLHLSQQIYGCRTVQKAFEHVLTDQQASLVKELDGHVLRVVENQHGNHVIQKAIECIPGEHIQFIVDAHKNQVVRLAKHTYGCRVVQRMLEHCLPRAKRTILDELHQAIPSLIDDPFGNYVIQNIITKGDAEDKYRVVNFVQQRLLYYSTHKFASNVVEKAIDHAEDSQRTSMLEHLTQRDPANNMQTPILNLIKDQYGNYVMQTVLKRIRGPAKSAVIDEVRHHLFMLSKINHSKQVAAMNKTLEEVAASRSPSTISTRSESSYTASSASSTGSVVYGIKTPQNVAST